MIYLLLNIILKTEYGSSYFTKSYFYLYYFFKRLAFVSIQE